MVLCILPTVRSPTAPQKKNLPIEGLPRLFGFSRSSLYHYFKESHKVLNLDCTSFDIFSNNLLELQQSADHYLLKPDFCYDDLPISLYQSMRARASAEELTAILSDYVRNHIPGNHALSRQEATAFLNGLIASLA